MNCFQTSKGQWKSSSPQVMNEAEGSMIPGEVNIVYKNILLIFNHIRYRIYSNLLWIKGLAIYSWAGQKEWISDWHHLLSFQENFQPKLWAFEDLYKQQNAEPCFDLTHLDWTKEAGGSGGPGWTGVYLPLQSVIELRMQILSFKFVLRGVLRLHNWISAAINTLDPKVQSCLLYFIFNALIFLKWEMAMLS